MLQVGFHSIKTLKKQYHIIESPSDEVEDGTVLIPFAKNPPSNVTLPASLDPNTSTGYDVAM